VSFVQPSRKVSCCWRLGVVVASDEGGNPLDGNAALGAV
jgi:hypothetical protein